MLALLPLALAGPAHHAVHHAPAYGHPAPAYGHPAPAYGHPAPYHAPAYGYEQPKHNCSVVDVVETAEVCTPTLEKTCVPEVLPIKLIISVEQCYTVTRTVCTESIEVIPNEVCVYEYEQASEQTFEAEGHHSDAKTVEVVFVEVWFNKKNYIRYWKVLYILRYTSYINVFCLNRNPTPKW